MIKQNTLATTTIQVQKPNGYEHLEADFLLIRYVIPASFHQKDDNYKRMHIELKSQLSVPYLPYQFDKIEGPETMVIYALYPRGDSPISNIVLSFVSDDKLDCSEISFHQIALFNLIKLLQANFFGNFPYFASMGEYYIRAKGKDNWHTCMEIQIHGSNRNYVNNQEQLLQEFWITGHASYFVRPSNHPDANQKSRFPYYRLQRKDNFLIFEQLTIEEIDNYKGNLFQQYSNKSNPARLVYHAQNSSGLLPSRGYLLHQFLSRFISYLQNYGLTAQKKERTWTQYTPPKNLGELPQRLSRVYLFDNRENQEKYSLSMYHALLQNYYDMCEFLTVTRLEETNGEPTLILADTNKHDYEEGGLFFGEEDSYQRIAKEYPHIPKQSINVNINSDSENFAGTCTEYLDYPLIALTASEDLIDEDESEGDDTTDDSWAMLFDVCLYQLCLKNIVINQLPVSEFLPMADQLSQWTEFAYIRKETYRGNSYHVMMIIEEGKPHFYNLADPIQGEAASNLMKNWDYDWFEVEELLLEKYHKKKNKKPEVKRFDLILKPNLAIELETMTETVLYKYDEIERRFNVRQERRKIEDFGLAQHYDLIRPENFLSFEDLDKLDLLNGRKPHEKTETASIAFYSQLQAYDALLIDIGMLQSKIAYDELVELRNQEIGKIFELPSIKDSKPLKYSTKRLLAYYKTIWNIGGFKSDDVQISKGIWFNPQDLAYVVGDINGFNAKQDTANLVRRFDILVGQASDFNMEVFLATTAVKFIRYKQYTVYPYPFYLIDKYIQDVLYHGI